MRLQDLLLAADVGRPRLEHDPQVAAVTEDSRQVTPGALFVAIAGTREDGARYAAEAIAKGAAAVAAAVPPPPGLELPADVPWIEVGDARCALARLAAAFHGSPARHLALTGVTGSKGKTTTCFLLAAAAEAAGEATALVTTALARTGVRERPSSLTTPPASELHALLAEAVAAKMAGAVIEVSSHALEQERVHGLRFGVGVFTNLFPDHLDYHPDVESYFQAKRRLFAGESPCRRAVIGIDGRHGARLAAEHPAAVTFGSSAEADVRPLTVEVSREGTRVLAQIPGGQVLLDSPLLGRFNASNLLAAAAYAVARGFPPEAARAAARTVEVVPGRMEPVDAGQPFTCLVDYAHNGPALEAALEATREWTSGRVLVVFGAGGNRDRERRRAMGAAAARLAHRSFLTSDNPRDEDPVAILQEIEAAYRGAGGDPGAAAVLLDRREAIGRAVEEARPGDTVLVAGKGHETVQVAAGVRRPFDDRRVLREALSARGYAADAG